jgi:hypothetical protein
MIYADATVKELAEIPEVLDSWQVG